MNYKESSSIPFPKRNDVLIQPNFWYPNFDLKIHVKDYGGAGDCLLLCFQNYVAKPGDFIYSREKLYEFLGKPFNCFLEDDSLQVLCHLFRLNSLVVRVQGNDNDSLCCYLFDFGYENTIAIFNYYPNHFVLIDEMTGPDNLKIVSSHDVEIPIEFLSRTKKGCAIDLQKEECSVVEKLVWEDDVVEPLETMSHEKLEHKDESENMSDIVSESGSHGSHSPSVSSSGESETDFLGNPVPMDDLDPVILYSYLRDSNLFVFEDVSELLEIYDWTMSCLVKTLCHYNSQNMFFPEYFMKAAFKFRHNVFATLFLLTELTKVKMETDVPLSKYIESSKTPDYIKETDEAIHIIEFSVAGRYDTLDFYKGGYSYDIKYTTESAEITKKTGKQAIVHIVGAVLNEYNMDEINKQSVNIFGKSIDKTALRDFFKISNRYRKILTDNYTKGLYLSTPIKSIECDLNIHEQPALTNVLLLDPIFISKLISSIGYIKDRLSNLYVNQPLKSKAEIFYQLNSSKIGVRLSQKGTLLDKLYQTIEDDSSIQTILGFISIYDCGKRVSIEKVRGYVPVTVKKTAKVERLIKYKDNTYISVVYEREKPIYSDDYDPQFLEPNDIVELEKDTKCAFPKDYYTKLVSSMDEVVKSTDKKMLVNANLTLDNITPMVNNIAMKSLEINNRVKIFRPKQTMCIPFVSSALSEAPLEKLNISVMKSYCLSTKLEFTKALLQKAIDGKFSQNIREKNVPELRKLRSDYSDSHKMYYSRVREVGAKRYKTMSSRERLAVAPERMIMMEKRKAYLKVLSTMKIKTGVRLLRLNSSRNTIMGTHFLKEMSHYRNEKNILKGVGNPQDVQMLMEYFTSLPSKLMQEGFLSVGSQSLFNKERSPGSPFLCKEKDKFTQNWELFYNSNFKGRLIDQITEFGRRLATTVFAESTKGYNKDFVKIDNLGLNDVIVMIKGGSKIYKNQRSKLVKIIFPCDKSDLTFMGYQENEHFEKFRSSGKSFVCTPWLQLHQDVLYDLMSLPSRTFMNLYSTHIRAKIPIADKVPKLNMLPVILNLHNRRKTEKFMHNMRYMIVNLMGKKAQLDKIAEEFAGTNFTYLEAWLRHSLFKRYYKFASNIMKLRDSRRVSTDVFIKESGLEDLWYGEKMYNTGQLTMFVYVTYMMTRAPVNSSLEQAANLWTILEDLSLYNKQHSDVDGLSDHSLRMSALSFNPDVYDDDFKYDPVFSQFLGYRLAGYLQSQTNFMELNRKWDSLKKRSISQIANSNGLRGWKEDNFFSQKGYKIVYDKVIDIMEENDTDLNTLVDSYLQTDPVTAYEMIKSDNIHVSEQKLDQIVFHVVHKIQRGGAREIFCMDINTKCHQNIIEDFFKTLCKMIPNEFISIPSNKRHSKIHTDFFERPIGMWVKQTVRWVLDCRRWAPHSVFQKYMHFVHGAREILPPDFYNFFQEFGKKMFKKKFVTREHVISKMKNHHDWSSYSTHVKDYKFKGSYYMDVPFSFVMGIFNYLSSLMHAANQIVAVEVIRDYNLRSGDGLVILDPKCHSDDSVVTSYHEKESSIDPSIAIYDWLLKSANHMLSIKKSQINYNVYLEFLSTLYIMDRFIPVIPKFVSTLPFKPSDEGYASDISFAITQCIEMISQGGSFEEAFLILKLTEKHVQRLYCIGNNANLPPQLLGNVDSHPLEYLCSGSLADMYNHVKYNYSELMSVIKTFSKLGLISTTGFSKVSLSWDLGSFLPMKAKMKYKALGTKIEALKEKCSWTISNTVLGNDYLNLIWYYYKMQDPKFYSSIISEPDARRMSRILGAAKYRLIKGDNIIKVSDLVLILKQSDLIEANTETESQYDGEDKVFNVLVESLSGLHDALKDAKLVNTLSSDIKDKPISFYMNDAVLGKLRIDAASYVSYIHEPFAFRLLGKRSNPGREVEKVTQFLNTIGIVPEEVDPDSLFVLVNKILRGDKRGYVMISCTYRDNRTLNDYQSMVRFLETNSIRHQKYQISAKNTSIVDWSRRISAGNTPKIVLSLMADLWAWDFFEEQKVTQYDIFKLNPKDRFKENIVKCPLDWRPLLFDHNDVEGKPLIDISYWTYWGREQIKVGHKWYGQGNLTVSLPETEMHWVLDSGLIIQVDVTISNPIKFSRTSCWFISNFLNANELEFRFIDSEYIEPSKLVFGYNIQSRTYGVDFPFAFDYALDDTNLDADFMEPFMYETCNSYFNKSHYFLIFEDDTKKVDFFVPYEKSIKISLKDYIDTDKLRGNMKESAVRNFVINAALEGREDIVFDRNTVLENIGRTTLFKIVRSSSLFNEIHSGKDMYLKNSFIQSLDEWKTTHEEFGFPNKEQLKALLIDQNLPGLPLQVTAYLQAIGESEVSENDFSSIVTKLSVLKDDEEMVRYLMSVLPNLSINQKMSAITMAVRSDRIYDACVYMSKDVFKILNPMYELLVDSIEDIASQSSTLMRLRNSMNKGKSLKDTFKTVFLYTLRNAYHSKGSWAYSDYNTQLLCHIINELYDYGLKEILEIKSCNIALINSISFDIPKEKFIKWIVDLLDNAFKTYLVVSSKTIKNRDFFGESGKLNVYSSPYRAWMMKRNFNISPDSIKIKFTKKKKTKSTLVLNQVSGIVGVTLIPFVPLDEDGLDEFEFSYAEDDDVIEFCTFLPKEEWDLPQYAYVKKQSITYETVTSARGTAWNVFVSGSTINNNINRIHGYKKIYKKTTSANPNLAEYLESNSNFIAYFGVEGVNCEIVGYKEMTHMEQQRYFKNPYNSSIIEIEGKEYYKEKIHSDRILRLKLDNIDQYFKQMKNLNSVKKEVKRQKRIISIEEELEMTEDVEFRRKLINSMKAQGLEIPHENAEEAEKTETKTLEDVLSSINLSDVADKGSKGDVHFATVEYHPVKNVVELEPLSVLSDEKFLGEFNSLFPGFLNMYMNNEIYLREDKKRRKIEFANYKIAAMPREMQIKYRRLLLIVKFFLKNIQTCKSREHETNEFGDAIDDLFDIDLEPAGENYEEMCDLMIDTGEVIEYPSLDFLR